MNISRIFTLFAFATAITAASFLSADKNAELKKDLVSAIEKADFDLIKQVLDKGAPADFMYHLKAGDQTLILQTLVQHALYFECKKNIIQLLVEHGAKVSYGDWDILNLDDETKMFLQKYYREKCFITACKGIIIARFCERNFI